MGTLIIKLTNISVTSLSIGELVAPVELENRYNQ